MRKDHEAKKHKIKKDLKEINNSVDLKKNFLSCLDEQINKYPIDLPVFNKNHLTPKVYTE